MYLFLAQYTTISEQAGCVCMGVVNGQFTGHLELVPTIPRRWLCSFLLLVAHMHPHLPFSVSWEADHRKLYHLLIFNNFSGPVGQLFITITSTRDNQLIKS